MKKEQVLSTIKKIINECGLDEMISVSSKEYEFADLHTIDDDYLGYCGIKLIKFEDIDDIFYSTGEDAYGYYYYGSEFALHLEFNSNWKLYFEWGELALSMFLCTECDFIETDEKIVQKLQEYNNRCRQRDKILTMLEFLPDDEQDLDYAELWYNEAIKYMDECSNSKDNDIVLFTIVYFAYKYFELSDNDKFHLREWIGRLIEDNNVYSCLEYIDKKFEGVWINNEMIDLEKCILKIKQEIETEGAE